MNRSQRWRGTVLVVTTVAVCSRPTDVCAQERVVTLDTVAVERALREELARTRTPGASIAIVVDGRLAYAKAIGVSDVETETPMTSETLVRIGSITKSFTRAHGVAARRSWDGRSRSCDRHVYARPV